MLFRRRRQGEGKRRVSWIMQGRFGENGVAVHVLCESSMHEYAFGFMMASNYAPFHNIFINLSPFLTICYPHLFFLSDCMIYICFFFFSECGFPKKVFDFVST